MVKENPKQISFTAWLALHSIVGVRPDDVNAKRSAIECTGCGKYKFLYHVPGDDECFSSYCYACMKSLYSSLVKEGTLKGYIEQM